MKFDSYEEFFKAYKEYRISQITDLDSHIRMQLDHDYNQENIYTIKNELVKSKGEAMIANFLFMHNISYDYEKIYPELLDNNKPYHPDFTIYLGSEEIYIEYFPKFNYYFISIILKTYIMFYWYTVIIF